MSEPENLVLKHLREMRGEIGDIRLNMATKKDLAEGLADVRSDVKSLRADVASDLMTIEKRLSERISHVNSAVIQYHSTTVGHGVLIGELDERLRRVEQHLKLPEAERH